MVVYHVCSYKKLQKYIKTGAILPPVRAWKNIQHAERMSLSTGRKIILRLKFPEKCDKLEGHFGEARIIRQKYVFNSI